MIKDNCIDSGKGFDWGRTSADYAKYRDIYPQEFYQRILDAGLCTAGQQVLDIGTGTGVLPRNLYRYGACFTGTDIAENQITQAKRLAAQENMDIHFLCVSAETMNFSKNTFDTVTACQCFFYFNHSILAPKIYEMLKPNGCLAVFYMAWLPFEDKIAGESERLILKYNPDWSGCNETRRPNQIPNIYRQYFETEQSEIFDLQVPFTRESWNGRMKACRGIGASLPQEEVRRFEKEHMALLNTIAPKEFNILHYAAITVLRVKK